MKVTYRLPKVEVEVDGDSNKDCFDKLAAAAEVFTAISRCGACDSENTVPVVRENAGVTFRESLCLDCGCRLGFGQKKSDGSLFPRKKNGTEWLPNNGWTKWQGKPKDDAADFPEGF